MNTVEILKETLRLYKDSELCVGIDAHKTSITALKEAIRAVELLPELVDDIEYLLVCIDEGYRKKDIKPIILEHIENRVKKAKGEI